jgi:hypothetical protein
VNANTAQVDATLSTHAEGRLFFRGYIWRYTTGPIGNLTFDFPGGTMSVYPTREAVETLRDKLNTLLIVDDDNAAALATSERSLAEAA